MFLNRPGNITRELRERGIHRMPRNLDEAVQQLKQDKFVTGAIGEALAQKFIEAKELEWARFENHVHQWEIDEYLPVI